MREPGPGPRFRTLFSAAATVLLVAWLPLATLQQIDALLAYMTWAELGDNVALMAALLVSGSALLAAIAVVAQKVLRPLSIEAATVAAWSLMIVPIVSTVFARYASAARKWLDVAFHLQLHVGPFVKIALLAAVVAFTAWQVRRHRQGKKTLFTHLAEALRAARPFAVALTLLSVAWLLWRPPVVHLGEHAGGVTKPGTSAPSNAPDVFLISIDTLSEADANPCGPGDVATMPNLRRLVARSTCFSRFYASSNFTTPTTSTMETGLLPWTHWAVQIGSKLDEAHRNTSLALGLREAGYATHSITANPQASPRQHGTWRWYSSDQITRSDTMADNLSAGLTVFADSALTTMKSGLFSVLSVATTLVNGTQHPHDPRRVYDRALQMLDAAGSARQPNFFWLHTLPPHAPYLPPASTRHRLLPAGQLEHWRDFLPDNSEYPAQQQATVNAHRLRYRESIMGADEALGEFLDALERAGRLDKALIIVTSDHGESFEKGYLGHAGQWLHESLIRIPFVVKLPGQNTGRVIATPVSQADLTPTVLDAVGAKTVGLPMDGRSLTGPLRGETVPSSLVYSMSLERSSRFAPLEQGQVAVIDGPLKAVFDIGSGKATLFDVLADPGESNDLGSTRPQDLARLQAALKARLASAETARSRNFHR